MKRILPHITLCLFVINQSFAQNTIGTTLNSSGSLEGYTLITPNSNALPNYTYLIDNCGKVVNSWESTFKGQGADIIMPDGSLFRGAFDDQSTLNYPGNNGRLEHFDWDGNLIWGYTHSATDYSFHHDYFVLDNGNILMLVAERKSNAEAIQAGRDPSTLTETDLYTEKVIEITPVGTNSATIVWEWDIWNHLIQDFDNTKDNFGVVADNPGKIDINYLGTSGGNADWIHFNSLDYNADLDQIVIGSRATSELYIIDHSTSTAQAAGNTGGTSGLGGQFMYRWGNPEAYDRGTAADKKLFGQHDVHWLPAGFPDAGKLMVFNNGLGRNFTTIEFIDTPVDINGDYPISTGQPFLPTDGILRYQDPTPTNFYASFISGANQLSNGNILINNGPVGVVFEVDMANQKVWEYINPVTINSGTLSQLDAPGGISTRFFRAERYEADYVGFTGRDLTPGAEIELNPIPANCMLLSLDDVEPNSLGFYPNPVQDILNIDYTEGEITLMSVYDISGKTIYSSEAKPSIDFSPFESGIYFVHLETNKGKIVTKVLKN